MSKHEDAMPKLTMAMVARAFSYEVPISLIRTQWKDGIDIDVPAPQLEALCRAYATEAVRTALASVAPAELQADAERYRWLRDKLDGGNWERVYDDAGRDLLDGEALDKAIDAARAPAA